MRISNQKTHPQARLIPQQCWETFFRGDLDDQLIELMAIETEAELMTHLKVFVTSIKEYTQWNVWLALYFSHPQLSLEQLDDIAGVLGLPLHDRCELAAISGHLAYLQYIERSNQGTLNQKVYNRIFFLAAVYGHLEILQYLAEKVPDRLQNMIADEWSLFARVASNGHHRILRFLAEKAPGRLQELFGSINFDFIAYQGYLEVLRFLAEQAPKQFHKMIAADRFTIFRDVAKYGRLDILRFLAEQASDQLQNMIAANDFAAFTHPAMYGYLEVMRFLAEIASDRLQDMIAADNFLAFVHAAGHGHLEIVRFLAEMAGNRLQDMIAANSFHAFVYAARNGHIEVVRFLAEKASDRLQDMIAACNFAAFTDAPSNSHYYMEVPTQVLHMQLLRFLEEKSPERLPDMIAADNFRVFRKAAFDGHLEVLYFLEEKAPVRLQDMIAADNFYAFRLACVRGHLLVLRYLGEKALSLFAEWIVTDDFAEFESAIRYNQHNLVSYFLSHNVVFSYAERDTYGYNRHYLEWFVTKNLASLRTQKQALELENPDAVFNIEKPEELRLSFYCLRYFIRRNDSSLQDQLLFLLAIPGVKALAHTENNELLVLALSVNNQTAASRLLDIPAVQVLAEANNYYRPPQREVAYRHPGFFRSSNNEDELGAPPKRECCIL